MTDLIVREAKDEDGPALAALLRTVVGDQAEGAWEASDQPALDRPASNFEARGGRLWAVMRQDEAVGALGVYRRARPDEFDLALVGLDREARGMGLATALLAGAEAFVAASGGEALGIWVDTRLGDAIAFLERHGFVREPGLKGRQDGSDGVEARFKRNVGDKAGANAPVSPRPSGAPRADAG